MSELLPKIIHDEPLARYTAARIGGPADWLYVARDATVLVVEVFTPNGQTAGNSFFIGSNALGQTAPSYLAAADCGVTEPTDTAAIGFPGMHIGRVALHLMGHSASPVILVR